MRRNNPNGAQRKRRSGQLSSKRRNCRHRSRKCGKAEAEAAEEKGACGAIRTPEGKLERKKKAEEETSGEQTRREKSQTQNHVRDPEGIEDKRSAQTHQN